MGAHRNCKINSRAGRASQGPPTSRGAGRGDGAKTKRGRDIWSLRYWTAPHRTVDLKWKSSARSEFRLVLLAARASALWDIIEIKNKWPVDAMKNSRGWCVYWLFFAAAAAPGILWASWTFDATAEMGEGGCEEGFNANGVVNLEIRS